MTAGYHEVEDSKSMFSFLKDTIIPSLAPSVPSPAMQSTWMTVINNQNNNVQTLKDGRLNIQNNIFTLRQIRSKNLYISNGEEEKNQIQSWMKTLDAATLDFDGQHTNNNNNKNNNNNDVHCGTDMFTLSHNQSTWIPTSPIFSATFSGSGYTTTLNVSLQSVMGPQFDATDQLSSEHRLQRGMKERSLCLLQKFEMMEKAGWIDVQTSAVVLEYCLGTCLFLSLPSNIFILHS